MLNQIIRYSLQNRGMVLTLAALGALGGVFTLSRLQVDVLPDLNRDNVTVLIEAPQLAPEEIESQIVRSIEAAVQGVSSVQHVRSIAGAGFASVRAELSWQADTARCRFEIQERLAQIQSKLPRNATVSLAPNASVMGEIMLIGLTQATVGEQFDPMEARDAAAWIVRPRLLSIPGVQQVTVWGGQVKQYQILADPEHLRLYGLSFDTLAEVFSNDNQGSGAGFLSDGKREFSVRSLSAARSIEDLENSLVVMRENRPIRVRDVAEVRIGPAPSRGSASVDGKPAVILAIQKMRGADTLQLSKEIDAALGDLISALPRGLAIQPNIFRQSRFIDNAIHNVTGALRDGAILVAIVLLVLLMDLRATLVSLVALPLSVLFTALIFAVLGLSIDTMSLGGIALACGELVDDAILDAENIRRRLQQNPVISRPQGPRSFLEIVFSASSEVRGAIVFGTAAMLLACAPLMFLPGLEGRLFRPLLAAYLLSIGMSFLVSLTVTPALASLLFAKYFQSAPRRESVVLRGCKGLARRCYALTFSRPVLVIAFAFILIALSAAMLFGMRREFLPPFNEGTATVHVLCHPGISLEESGRRAAYAEEIMLGVRGVTLTGGRTGRTEGDEHAEGVYYSEIEVQLDNQARAQNEIIPEIRARLEKLPGVTIGISQPISHRIDHLISGVRAQVAIEIKGPDLGVLRSLARDASHAMSALSGLTDLHSEEQGMPPQILLQANPDAAARYGFAAGDLSRVFQTIISGKTVSQIADGPTRTNWHDVVLWTPERWRQNGEQLGEITLVSPSGAQARLADIATIAEQHGTSQIDREDGSRICRVTCNLKGRDLEGAAKAIQAAIANQVKIPRAYSIKIGGEFETQRVASRQMFALGTLALVAIFLILWKHFRSMATAMQIVLNVPFAFVGGVFALWLAGEPLSLAAIVGFISLAGVATRNGILIISHYVHLMNDEHMPFGRDMIERGSQERVAPVLMTATCAALALLPVILNPGQPGTEILYPVALVVVGGLFTCTLLDFAITPALFLYYSGSANVRANLERE